MNFEKYVRIANLFCQLDEVLIRNKINLQYPALKNSLHFWDDKFHPCPHLGFFRQLFHDPGQACYESINQVLRNLSFVALEIITSLFEGS